MVQTQKQKQRQKQKQKQQKRKREKKEKQYQDRIKKQKQAPKPKESSIDRIRRQAKKIGYKKLRDGLIAELEILGENNEDRSSIVDKRYAKMRCSQARVLNIYNLSDTTKSIKSGTSLHNSAFEYKIGGIVTPSHYSPVKNDICAGGIHYFLTREAAIGYDYLWHSSMLQSISHGLYTGTIIRARDDGSVCERIYFNEGMRYDPPEETIGMTFVMVLILMMAFMAALCFPERVVSTFHIM